MKYEIVKIICDYYNIKYDVVMSNSKYRKREHVLIRQYSALFIKKYCKLSFADIGKIFNKDHSTILSGVKTIKDSKEYNKKLENDYKEINKKVSKLFNKQLEEEEDIEQTAWINAFHNCI